MALRNYIRDRLRRHEPAIVFNPSDQELVVCYLRQRAANSPWPSLVIPDLTDIFHYNPWELPGDYDGEKKFFFCARTTNRENIANTNRGYWRHNVNQDLRVVEGTNSVAGIKKSWVFFHSGESNGSRWIMHEFSLARLTEGIVVEEGEWNVYRIYDESNEVDRFAEEENSDGSESIDEPDSPTSILDGIQSLEL